jgi:hypothetical protein
MFNTVCKCHENVRRCILEVYRFPQIVVLVGDVDCVGPNEVH